MSNLIINPHKRIGSVIYVVEGEKTEPELIRHIYQNILGYNTLTIKDGEIMSLNKSDDKYSFVYVITAKHPQISLLEEKSSLEYMSYIYRLLTHNYNLDVENNALYFIFDRDRQSNSKKFIKDKYTSAKKKKDFSKAEFLTYDEGLCVQCLHIGPYDEEPKTLAQMDAFAVEQGYRLDFSETRFHHEIYLSDPRRAAPGTLKTVLRHPIREK